MTPIRFLPLHSSRAGPRVRRLGLALLLCAMLAPLPGRADDGPPSFAPLVRRVLPGVVSIIVTQTVPPADALAALPPALRGTPFEQLFRDQLRKRPQKTLDAGSGFIIDASGLIVTNGHVIGNGRDIEVGLADGSTVRAEVVGVDDLTDIAVLRIHPPHPLIALSWGSSRAVEVGDWVVTAGNPFGLANSVTAGIVSARGRDIGAGPFDDFLQIDAPVNPGNSGGPVFNMRGEVVGIDTAIVSPTGGSVGIAFAIPSDEARPVVNELIAHHRVDRGWIGVALADISEDGTDPGVGVADVVRGSPAAQAGIRPGDIILAIDGQPIYNTLGLIRIVASEPPGRNVRLRIYRQGRAFEVSVVVGRRPPVRED